MKTRFSLAGVPVGRSEPVRILGVINVSPESFFKGSVKTFESSIAAEARRMEKEGADFIDVGAMSTAPYLKTRISETEEARRLTRAVKLIRKACSLPISIDTFRAIPAAEGLEAGAVILNDITGFHGDSALPDLARQAQGVILMAHPSALRKKRLGNPMKNTLRILRSSLAIARRHGVPAAHLVVDPGVGFFRNTAIPWWRWDLEILGGIKQLARLPAPLLLGVSRKSFIGHLSGGVPPEERLEGSLAATAIAVYNGASLIRTHDVAATRKSVDIATSMRNLGPF